ncbi:MAG: hypothetical protein E7253_02900 [Lachnospiraceae bacterium]|nr:hypothetical protein [Lachnospiraceae bacterium]
MEVKKSKEQIIEDLKNFIGRDVPEMVYDVAASAANDHPGIGLIDIQSYRNAAKVTDNENLAFWLASQHRKGEEVLVINQGKDGQPVFDTGYAWMSVREIADYLMEDVKYIQELLEEVNYDVKSEKIEASMNNLLSKRDFYLALSNQVGEVEIPVQDGVQKITLALLCEYLHVPFMELYTRYQISGTAADAISQYSDSLRKQAEAKTFADVVCVEDFMFEKELDAYHMLLFRASMKKKGMEYNVSVKEAYSFRKVEDYYMLFLKELSAGESHKEYYTKEEYAFLNEVESGIKEGIAVDPEILKYLLELLSKKQITKKENTRLFLYLAQKEGTMIG